jgi:hypothetical protein
MPRSSKCLNSVYLMEVISNCNLTLLSVLKKTAKYGELYFLGCKPSSPLNVIATYLTLVSSLAYSSTLKMEATCFSVTSSDFQQIARRYIREVRTLHNLKSYAAKYMFQISLYNFCRFSVMGSNALFSGRYCHVYVCDCRRGLD